MLPDAGAMSLTKEQEARDYADAAMRRRWSRTNAAYRKSLVNFIIDRYLEKINEVQPSLFDPPKETGWTPSPVLKVGDYITLPPVKARGWRRLLWWRKPPTLFQVTAEVTSQPEDAKRSA